jgi:hypothetical protein
MGPQPILATFAAKSASGGNGRGNVGLIQDAIGLQARGEGNGTACGQVNGAGEQLSVKLGSGLGEYVMDFAELDIEGKFEVTVIAKLYRDGVQVGPTETLSFVGSDSGPDSGARDNQRWRVPEDPDAPPVFFDEIRLSVSSATPGGAFSLEGGADGTVPGSLGTELGTADSLFHLTTVDGTLGCGETATEGSGITEPQASITLVDEAGCEPIPYNLEVDVNDDGWQTVLLQKPDGNAHFAITLRWQPEEALYPVPATLIDYGDGRGPHAMIWCDDLDGNEATDVEPWCVTDHHATLLADGQMQLTERLLGNGDPLNAR